MLSEKLIETVFVLPKNLRPREIFSITKHEQLFTITWRRDGRLFGCKNVEHSIAYPLIFACKDEIKSRKDPSDRVEMWECYDSDGCFSRNIYLSLLESRI